MIASAPTDFWERVVARVADRIFERETSLERSKYADKMPHLAPVREQALRNAIEEQKREAEPPSAA